MAAWLNVDSSKPGVQSVDHRIETLRSAYLTLSKRKTRPNIEGWPG